MCDGGRTSSIRPPRAASKRSFCPNLSTALAVIQRLPTAPLFQALPGGNATVVRIPQRLGLGPGADGQARADSIQVSGTLGEAIRFTSSQGAIAAASRPCPCQPCRRRDACCRAGRPLPLLPRQTCPSLCMLPKSLCIRPWQALICRQHGKPLPPGLDAAVARFLGHPQACYYWPSPTRRQQQVLDAVRDAWRDPVSVSALCRLHQYAFLSAVASSVLPADSAIVRCCGSAAQPAHQAGWADKGFDAIALFPPPISFQAPH